MSRESISTVQAPSPSGAYSQGIRAGNLLFISGQGPYDRQGNMVGGSITNQMRQVLNNLDAIARAAGTSLSQAVRIGVYLSDLAHFDEMDAVYRQFFEQPLPARTTIQSDLVGFDVEADAIIWLGD